MDQTSELTLEAMMQDSNASHLDKEDRPEVLSLLPPYEGKSVLELGAGIGRFTGELAKKAGQLIALDFIEDAINKNESTNGHHENAKFMCMDVTSQDLKLLPESIDLIFSNWLLMYLSDEEVKDLAERMINWLKVGGYIFFRESCFHGQSEDHNGRNNPTHYRESGFYTKVFRDCNLNVGAESYELSLIGFKCIRAYVRNKKNQNEICWIWQKVCSVDNRGFQHFLDNGLYKRGRILRFERVYGQGFMSPGGLDTTKELVGKLDLQPGQKVLDVGCGFGGSGFYMAKNYDVYVVGIDLSINMISLGLERSAGQNCAVEFEVADCTKKTYPQETFDVIYSRDAILHIKDKLSLFRSFYKWLKPGGKVLITDYCKRAGPTSESFSEYIKKRDLYIEDIEVYRQIFRDAGFDEVVAEDITAEFIKVSQKELHTIEKDKESFVQEFSEQDYNEIVEVYKPLLIRCSSGEQKWGLFVAKK